MKHWNLEIVVYRKELTYDGFVDILDIKFIAGSTVGYTQPPGLYETSDLNLMLKILLPYEVKVFITIDDIRLRSKLNTNKTVKFTKKTFFQYKNRLCSITLRYF